APAAAPPPAPSPVSAAAPAAPAVAAPAPAPAPASNEPLFAGPGFRRPTPEEPGCIERSIRIPQYLADRLPPAVLLRFAVGRDGTSDLVQVLPGAESGPGSRPVDPRLSESLIQAVRGCRFTPGADDAGRPARLWVTMRVRFAD
ncbi:MAG: energy transducer TonB, partial [Deltaproteobacteria bacterium]|nr:energy transducer TonB [Deltaproteobacteria bacterium]